MPDYIETARFVLSTPQMQLVLAVQAVIVVSCLAIAFGVLELTERRHAQ